MVTILFSEDMLRPLLGIARWNTVAGRCRQVAGGAVRHTSWLSPCLRIRRQPVQHDLPMLVDRLPGVTLTKRDTGRSSRRRRACARIIRRTGPASQRRQDRCSRRVRTPRPLASANRWMDGDIPRTGETGAQRTSRTGAAIEPVRKNSRLGRSSWGRRRFTMNPSAARRPETT